MMEQTRWRSAPAIALVLTLAGMGCAADTSAPFEDNIPSGPSAATEAGAAPEAPTTTTAPASSTAGSTATGEALSNPSGKPSEAGPPVGRVSQGSTPLPCEVDQVFATSCRSCHSAAPGAQAPMALITHEDLMAPAISQPAKSVWELVGTRVRNSDAPMPPHGSGRMLVNSELGVLDGWVQGGRRAGAEACNNDPAPPGTISDGKGIIDYTPPAADEIDECFEFFAHQNSELGDTTPFEVRPGGESYTAFFWEVPWDGQKQALEFRFNATAVTHHLLLYDTTEPRSDFEVDGNSSGSHPNAPDLLAAWAIGQQRVQTMPQTVGMHLPTRGTGHRFLVEVHYASYSDDMVMDRSGVEVCTGKRLRPNTATVSWLGTEAIVIGAGAAMDISGTCTPLLSQDVHIFRSFPHMHQLGTHLRTEIKRFPGLEFETLVDEPYNFNNQLMYDTPAIIRPGDQLITTCSYQNRTENTVTIGFGSSQEMCFNFVYAWPAKALIGGISLSGSATPCLL